MMPPRIWADAEVAALLTEAEFDNGTHYVRADVADALAKVLRAIADDPCMDPEGNSYAARAALTAYEETSNG